MPQNHSLIQSFVKEIRLLDFFFLKKERNVILVNIRHFKFTQPSGTLERVAQFIWQN